MNEPGVLSGERFVPQVEMFGRASRAARGFAEQGVGRGDAVGILLRNDIPFIEASLAAGFLGAYAVPVNWHWKADEVGHLLADSGAKLLVAHADLLPAVADGLPDPLPIVLVPTPPEVADAYGIHPDSCAVPSGLPSWDRWLREHEPSEPSAEASPGSMIYTSGTTGRPKGVRRQPPAPETAAGMLRIVQDVLGVKPGITTVIPAPMYHSAPNACGLAASLVGTVVLQPRFDPEELLSLIQRHRVDHVQLVPTMMTRLVRLPDEVKRAYDVSSLTFVVHAAAPCPPEVKRELIDWWGPIVNEYYGCTESGAVTFCTAEEWLSHPGTVGRAIEGATVRVLSPNGEELPPGEPGDVYVRLGDLPDFTYHGQDQRRREIEVEGLITCGDIGYLDAEGFLYLCDRRNDMVISGGVNIYPAEIESALLGMPGVRDCAVFGIPDDDYGEALAAVVEPEPGASLAPDDVRRWVAGRLASYKVPRVVELRSDLPREDTGKIFKRLLRDPYWEGKGRAI